MLSKGLWVLVVGLLSVGCGSNQDETIATANAKRRAQGLTPAIEVAMTHSPAPPTSSTCPWEKREFATVAELTPFLNGLGSRAVTAHVFAVPSSRNIGGLVFGTPYIVLYQTC